MMIIHLSWKQQYTWKLLFIFKFSILQIIKLNLLPGYALQPLYEKAGIPLHFFLTWAENIPSIKE